MEEITFSQQMVQILVPVLTTVVGILTSFALAYVSKWLKTKTENETALFTYEHAQGIIRDVVAKINQAVKEAGADGKITEDEALRIKQIAAHEFKQQLPPAMQAVLEKMVGDLPLWLDTQIEASVYEAKNGK